MSKKVCQYDVNTGELIAEYPSIIGASRETGCDRRTIQRQLKWRSKISELHILQEILSISGNIKNN